MTAYTVLIPPEELRAHLGEPGWVIIDSRFTLPDPGAGRSAYLESHIPGAVFADLEEDLSGPKRNGTGRHPLPPLNDLVRKLGEWGVDSDTQVVAYDASGGAMAGRLWWLLKWLGHERVAVLDGGWPIWISEGFPATPEISESTPRTFVPQIRTDLAVDSTAVDKMRGNRRWRLFDARSAERFRGENETIDPVAGHIPGAVSLPYAENLTPEGRFRPPAELLERFSRAMGSVPVEKTVCYCGSGVTAVHDILAMAHAGLGLAKLYPGSWSEWITDPDRPVKRG